MRKIFISYKYADNLVWPLPRVPAGVVSTARHYVDEIQQVILRDHIHKGELDGESLENFSEGVIESKLRDKIFDSSLTIILISKGMKDPSLKEQDQWIPWEIAYSLREQSREDRTSRTNAVLAIVLPDELGSYRYFIEPNSCPSCQTTVWKKDQLFTILGANMFNRKNPTLSSCSHTGPVLDVHLEAIHSYIFPVTWSEFVVAPERCLSHAYDALNNIEDFTIVKTV